MKELTLANEPYISKVTLPSGDTGAWFYNPDTTLVARFATKVVFLSDEGNEEYIYILLLPENHIDEASKTKACSIAEDLGSVSNQTLSPHYSGNIYSIEKCEIRS